MSIFSKLLNIVKWGGTDLTGRDISNDIKTLSDDTVKGILRSLGDAGASPTNASGSTLLQRIADLKNAPPKKPSGATQVAKSASANNATVIIHTVTAGKTLYLEAVCLDTVNAGAGKGASYIAVRDPSDVIQYKIIDATSYTDLAVCGSVNPATPYEIPEGYDIVLVANGTDVYSEATIKGYEE